MINVNFLQWSTYLWCKLCKLGSRWQVCHLAIYKITMIGLMIDCIRFVMIEPCLICMGLSICCYDLWDLSCLLTLDYKLTTHIGWNTLRMEYSAAIKWNEETLLNFSRGSWYLNLFFFFICVYWILTICISIQYAGGEILGDHYEQIHWGAPTSRAYRPASDCTWNTWSVCFLWISMDW